MREWDYRPFYDSETFAAPPCQRSAERRDGNGRRK